MNPFIEKLIGKKEVRRDVTVDRNISCCFTGHRNIPDEMISYLSKRITDGIEYLYSQGITTYLAGGALGFDTLAAKAVIEYRKDHRDIRLVLVLPCKDQAKMWQQTDVKVYESIKKSADDVICLSDHYYKGCMQDRNRYLVDHSSACICFLTQSSSGTAYTVNYAKSKGVSVFNLALRKK